MTAKDKVMIIIPAWNEGPHLARVIKAIPKDFTAGGREFGATVVVVDDGSADNTAAEARKAGATVLKHVANIGAGGATRTGLRYAESQGDEIAYAVTIDGDGQHAARDIKRLVAYAVKHDSHMVVGNRLHAKNKQHIPLQRRVVNWGGSLFSRMLFGIRTRDTQSGLRLYSVEAIPYISHFTLDRYGFCTETLWHAVRNGLRIDEVPITVSYSKESMARGQSIWASMEVVRDLVKVRIAG